MSSHDTGKEGGRTSRRVGDRLWVGRRPGPWLLLLGLGRLQGPVRSGEVRRASGPGVSEEAAANLSPWTPAEAASEPAASARPSAGCARPPRFSLGLRREPPNWLDGSFFLKTRRRRRGSATGPPPEPRGQAAGSGAPRLWSPVLAPAFPAGGSATSPAPPGCSSECGNEPSGGVICPPCSCSGEAAIRRGPVLFKSLNRSGNACPPFLDR